MLNFRFLKSNQEEKHLKYSDIDIFFLGDHFKFHKCLLIKSSYFDDLLEIDDTNEIIFDRSNIPIKSSNCFNTYLNYLYSNSIDGHYFTYKDDIIIENDGENEINGINGILDFFKHNEKIKTFSVQKKDEIYEKHGVHEKVQLTNFFDLIIYFDDIRCQKDMVEYSINRCSLDENYHIVNKINDVILSHYHKRSHEFLDLIFNNSIRDTKSKMHQKPLYNLLLPIELYRLTLLVTKNYNHSYGGINLDISYMDNNNNLSIIQLIELVFEKINIPKKYPLLQDLVNTHMKVWIAIYTKYPKLIKPHIITEIKFNLDKIDFNNVITKDIYLKYLVKYFDDQGPIPAIVMEYMESNMIKS